MAFTDTKVPGDRIKSADWNAFVDFTEDISGAAFRHSSNIDIHLSPIQKIDLTDGGDSILHYHTSDRDLSNATGTLAVALGGTNANTFTQNKFIYYDGTRLVASPYFYEDFISSGASTSGTVSSLKYWRDYSGSKYSDTYKWYLNSSQILSSFLLSGDEYSESYLWYLYSSARISDFILSGEKYTKGYLSGQKIQSPKWVSPTAETGIELTGDGKVSGNLSIGVSDYIASSVAILRFKASSAITGDVISWYPLTPGQGINAFTGKVSISGTSSETISVADYIASSSIVTKFVPSSLSKSRYDEYIGLSGSAIGRYYPSSLGKLISSQIQILSLHSANSFIHFTKQSINLDDLGDVNTAGAGSGMVLTWNDTEWIAKLISGTAGGGALSTLIIDADKDWSSKGIYNLSFISSSTISGGIIKGVWAGKKIDISDYTNLAVSSPLILSDDTIEFDLTDFVSSTNALAKFQNSSIAISKFALSSTYFPIKDWYYNSAQRISIMVASGDAYSRAYLSAQNVRTPDWQSPLTVSGLSKSGIGKVSGSLTLYIEDYIASTSAISRFASSSNIKLHVDDESIHYTSGSIKEWFDEVYAPTGATGSFDETLYITSSNAIARFADSSTSNTKYLQSGIASVNGLSDVDTVSIAPVRDYTLKWNGNKWVPAPYDATFVFSINTFSDNEGTTQLIGTGVWKASGEMSYSATYNNGPPESTFVQLSINGGAYNNVGVMTGPNYTTGTNNVNINYPSAKDQYLRFRLSANVGTDKSTKTESAIYFRNYVYYGVLNKSDSFTEADIKGLTGVVTNAYTTSRTLNAGPGEHLIIAYPATYTTIHQEGFKYNHITCPFSSASIVSITNSAGYTENYRVHPSKLPNLGNYTLELSTSSTLINMVYYGTTTKSGGYTEEDVENLSESTYTNTYDGTVWNELTCGAGEYLLFAFPKRWGEKGVAYSFYDNATGFEAAFLDAETVSVTNSNGYVEDYYVYRSENSDLEPITIRTD